MKTAYLLLFASLLGAFACSPRRVPGIPDDLPKLENVAVHKTDMSEFLAGAVLYGMQRDHFPPDIAASLLNEKENWVEYCPICDNVKRGMVTYQRSELQEAKTRLKKDDAEALRSGEDDIRRPALKALIDRYVQQYYTALSMTDDERQAMGSKLGAGRKKGMAQANGGAGFYCPSCDGACHKPAD